MLADGSGRNRASRVGWAGLRRPPFPRLTEANPDVTPFDRLGRFVVRRAWWLVAALGRPAAAGDPVRAAGPGPAERRRVHPRRPRIGAGQGAARGRARRPAVGPGRRLLQPDTLEAGTPAFELAAAEAIRDVATAPHVARVVSHLVVAAPGLGRPPHGLRHRLPRPPGRRFARCPADPARAPAPRARARCRAGRRTRLLRRRPDGLRGRSAAERADLAAARGARAAPRLRLGGCGRRPADRRRRRGHRRAGGDLRGRIAHADEHLRAEPRDAPRSRAWASTTRCS